MLFSYRYVVDKQVSEDIVQDIFVYLWNNMENIDFSNNIKAYLYTAARNKSLLFLDKKKVRKNYLINLEMVELDQNTPESIAITKETSDALAKTINKLPSRRKEIFLMHRFDGLKYAEIATTLGLSVKTVETQMSRAYKHLRKHILKNSDENS